MDALSLDDGDRLSGRLVAFRRIIEERRLTAEFWLRGRIVGCMTLEKFRKSMVLVFLIIRGRVKFGQIWR